MPSREVINGAAALVGKTVRGKWRLDALLGVGGSAAVYSATHRNGKRGALKILRRDLAYDPELRERFLREGYVANLVGHPGVVAMLDDDIDDDGSPFLVMELLEGSTLERIIRKRKSMPLREVLRVAESVLDMLAAAHSQGIVHGDIKPANVFLTTANEVKLLDFGIARITGGPDEDTDEGGTLGTPAYMSPEQARGDAVDGRTDLWAVGALMFALITGERPRQGASAGEELVMARSEPMRKLATMAPQLSGELAAIVDRAMTFERAARWRDAMTMQQALRLALLLEQASGPAYEGVQVPLPLAPGRDERTSVDAFRILRGPASSRGSLRAALPSGRPEAATKPQTHAPSGKHLSSLPPGVTTGHRLAFAATIPPPARSKQLTPSTLSGAPALSAALLAIGLGLGALFTGPFLDDSQSALGGQVQGSRQSAPDAGSHDASLDATKR